MNISLVEGLMVIGLVLTLGIGYTALYVKLYKDMKKQQQVEKEYCPSLDDNKSED